MDNALLTTKLYIPPLRPNLVQRARLWECLDAGLRQGHTITLVCAPAGFGKTTLVASWIYRSTREIAWLSLDEGDDDPVRFLTHLIAALQQVDGRIGRTLEPALLSPQTAAPQALAVTLINDVIAAGVPLILALDDLHLVRSEAAARLLRFWVAHQPPNMHLVITTREDPPLPLASLRARNTITELRQADLRFTPEEAAAFLAQTMGLALPPDAVRTLEVQTEGWITGLQLAALALRERGERAVDIPERVDAFGGDAPYVMDYLLTEVLQRQSRVLQRFILETSILDRFSPALCDAVTGRADSRALLEELASAHAFLVPLDRQGGWFRYHRLFAEALRGRLAPGERAALHRRAAAWYEGQGLVYEAIHHALAGAVEETAQAERLIAEAAETTLFSGGLLTLRGWLAALPPASVRANPHLALYHSWVLALTGGVAAAEDLVAVAESAPDAVAARALVLRGFIELLTHQRYAAAVDRAQAALRLLPDHQRPWRVIALWILAEALERTGPITGAIAAFREARETGLGSANRIFVATVEMSLAMALNANGQRAAAVRVCEEAVARYTDEDGNVSPLAALILSRLGVLYYEANQLTLARQCHDQAAAFTRELALGADITFAQGMAAKSGQSPLTFDCTHIVAAPQISACIPRAAQVVTRWRGVWS